MADTKLNQFVSAGSAAARAAYTPTPPTPASGPTPGYFWHETDTGDTYSWKAGTGWIKVNSGGFTTASTTEQLTGTDTTKGATSDSVAALWEQGSDVASAGTISLGEGGYFNITGTTTITDIDFATDKAGRKAWVKFAGILTLTHNASTLILPSGASITTAAGDTACFVSEGSDVVRCVAYNRASGAALVGGGGASGTSFPGSPSTSDRYFRTDRGIEYYYDGTRWVSMQIHTLQITQRDTAAAQPLTSGGSANNRVGNPWSGVYDIYMLDYVMAGVLTSASTGTNYLTSRLAKSDGAVDTNLGSGLSSQSDTQNSHVTHREALNAVAASTVQDFVASFTKVGGGAVTYYVTTLITYRLVG